MRKLLAILFVILFVSNANADKNVPSPKPRPATQLLLNITVPCREDGVEYISEIVNYYKEEEFASGTFSFKPINLDDFQEADFLMYVSKDRKTFSIFSFQDFGDRQVACVIIGGNDLEPFDGKYRK
jgi:hypothetical protein